MSRQKDIIRTFQHLQGDERLELMCCLLDCCLPLELRFLATYVEFLAKEHYLFLKKWEVIANSISSDSSWQTDLSSAKNRRLLCTYMALLYSHNTRISAKFVGVLSSFLDEHSFSEELAPSNYDNTNQLSQNDWNELRLLLTMACYHPAFKFVDKQTLFDKLKSSQSKLSRKQSKTSKHRRPNDNKSNEVTDMTTNEKCERPPMESNADCNDSLDYFNENNHSPLMLPDETMAAKFEQRTAPSPAKPPPINNNDNNNSNAVIITAPVIQSVPIFAQVVQTCDPTNGTKQDCTNSFVPASNGMLSPQQLYSASQQAAGRSNFGLHSSSAPIPVLTGRHNYAQGYTNQLQTSHAVNSPSNLLLGSSPALQSPLHSPHVSPKSSPRPSPCPSPMFGRKSTGETVHNKKYQILVSVYDWLRSLRLHKYLDVFENHSFEMIAKMTEEELIEHGLTQGARKKLRLNIESLRDRGFQDFGPDNPLDVKVPVQPEPNAHNDRQKAATFQNSINNVPVSVINGCNSNSVTGTSLPGTAMQYLNPNTQSLHTSNLIVPMQAASPHIQTASPQMYHCDFPTQVENIQNPNQILLQSPPMSNQFLFPIQLADPNLTVGNPQDQQNHPQQFVTTCPTSQQFQTSSMFATTGKFYQDNDQLSLHQISLGNYDNNKPNCYNCGSLSHSGEMCNLDTFESSDHSFSLKYEEPKRNSSSSS